MLRLYGDVLKLQMKASQRELFCLCCILPILSINNLIISILRIVCTISFYYWPFQGSASFVENVCYICLVFDMLFRLFIAALWSPAGKRVTSWLLFVRSNCDFVTFPCGILGQVWYLIVLIPDLCRLSNFVSIIRLWRLYCLLAPNLTYEWYVEVHSLCFFPYSSFGLAYQKSIYSYLLIKWMLNRTI